MRQAVRRWSTIRIRLSPCCSRSRRRASSRKQPGRQRKNDGPKVSQRGPAPPVVATRVSAVVTEPEPITERSPIARCSCATSGARCACYEQRMRITDIRETSIALNSTLKNSIIDFSEMTTSVVAVITDVMRGGKPVTGFAFNSTGRYACGAQMRARFIPRLLKRRPEVAAQRGGRQSRSGEVRRRDDAQREVRRPLGALDRHRHHRGRDLGRGRQDRRQAAASRCSRSVTTAARSPAKCFVYVGGGWYAPGKGIPESATR